MDPFEPPIPHHLRQITPSRYGLLPDIRYTPDPEIAHFPRTILECPLSGTGPNQVQDIPVNQRNLNAIKNIPLGSLQNPRFISLLYETLLGDVDYINRVPYDENHIEDFGQGLVKNPQHPLIVDQLIADADALHSALLTYTIATLPKDPRIMFHCGIPYFQITLGSYTYISNFLFIKLKGKFSYPIIYTKRNGDMLAYRGIVATYKGASTVSNGETDGFDLQMCRILSNLMFKNDPRVAGYQLMELYDTNKHFVSFRHILRLINNLPDLDYVEPNRNPLLAVPTLGGVQRVDTDPIPIIPNLVNTPVTQPPLLPQHPPIPQHPPVLPSISSPPRAREIESPEDQPAVVFFSRPGTIGSTMRAPQTPTIPRVIGSPPPAPRRNIRTSTQAIQLPVLGSVQSPRSAESPQPVQSPRSAESPQSAQSPRSAQSAESPRSAQSAESPRSPLSQGSIPVTRQLVFSPPQEHVTPVIPVIPFQRSHRFININYGYMDVFHEILRLPTMLDKNREALEPVRLKLMEIWRQRNPGRTDLSRFVPVCFEDLYMELMSTKDAILMFEKYTCFPIGFNTPAAIVIENLGISNILDLTSRLEKAYTENISNREIAALGDRVVRFAQAVYHSPLIGFNVNEYVSLAEAIIEIERDVWAEYLESALNIIDMAKANYKLHPGASLVMIEGRWGVYQIQYMQLQRNILCNPDEHNRLMTNLSSTFRIDAEELIGQITLALYGNNVAVKFRLGVGADNLLNPIDIPKFPSGEGLYILRHGFSSGINKARFIGSIIDAINIKQKSPGLLEIEKYIPAYLDKERSKRFFSVLKYLGIQSDAIEKQILPPDATKFYFDEYTAKSMSIYTTLDNDTIVVNRETYNIRSIRNIMRMQYNIEGSYGHYILMVNVMRLKSIGAINHEDAFNLQALYTYLMFLEPRRANGREAIVDQVNANRDNIPNFYRVHNFALRALQTFFSISGFIHEGHIMSDFNLTECLSTETDPQYHRPLIQQLVDQYNTQIRDVADTRERHLIDDLEIRSPEYLLNCLEYRYAIYPYFKDYLSKFVRIYNMYRIRDNTITNTLCIWSPFLDF